MSLKSLFTQRFDRVAFVAYLLGAVVPLAALAVIAGSAAPTLIRGLSISWTGFVLSVAILSLASFLALRRMAHEASRRMGEDHLRLLTLLNASSALSGAVDEQRAAEAASRQAVSLVGALAAFVYWRGLEDEDASLLARAGFEPVAEDEQLNETIRQAALLTLSSGRPELRWRGATGDDGSTWDAPTTVIVPMNGCGVSRGALAVVRSSEAGGFIPADLDALSTLAGFTTVALIAARQREAERLVGAPA